MHTETYTHNGFIVRLTQDDCPESPADWGRDDAFVVGFHSDFSVEYEDVSVRVKSKEDAFWLLPKDEIIKSLIEDGYEPDEAQDEADSGHVPGYSAFPLQAYIHGGVHLSLSGFECPWDSGQVGWVFVKEADHRDDFGEHETARHRVAKSLVHEWNQYLNGDVWVVCIENGDGEILDSYGGVYGMENALEAAKNDSIATDSGQTKLVSVKVLNKDGTWTREQAPVPLTLGNSEVPGWLLEHWICPKPPSQVDSIVFVREITEGGEA